MLSCDVGIGMEDRAEINLCVPPHFDLRVAGRGSCDSSDDRNIETSSGFQSLGSSIEGCQGGDMTAGFRHKTINVAYNVSRMTLSQPRREDVCAQIFRNAVAQS